MHELMRRGMRRTLAQGEGDGTASREGTGELFRQRGEAPAVTRLPPCNSAVGRGREVSASRSEEGWASLEWKLWEQPEAKSHWPFCLPGIVIRSLVSGAGGQGPNPITWRAG